MNLFIITFFLSILVLIIGLIKPSVLKIVFATIPKRKTIALICSGAIVISFIGIGLFAPHAGEKKDINTLINNIEQQPTPLATTKAENSVISAEPVITGSDNKIGSQITEINTAQLGKPASIPTTQTSPQYEYYSIASIVDGDTIKININGTVETLRLIGIDTPETVDPRKTVQCFGKEASDKAKALLSGKKVRIEQDPTQGERDKYARLLAYVYRDDGLFYNKYMIEQGYAHEYTYNTPYKYQTEFKVAQKEAQDNQIGFWSPNTCNGDTTKEAIHATSNQSAATSTPTISKSAVKYYTSSYSTSKYYYPESCVAWQSLSTKYLKFFDSLDALLKAYPSRTLSPLCR